ncbi:hypothetical protein Trydic_g7921 [Trypoxylus dichotomus]
MECNLDGSGEFPYYCHGLRKEQVVPSRQRIEAARVIVLRATSYNESIDLVILNGRQNSEKYIQLLEEVKDKFIPRAFFDAGFKDKIWSSLVAILPRPEYYRKYLGMIVAAAIFQSQTIQLPCRTRA